METHQKDIEENDPFGQNRNEADDDDADDDEKSFLKALQLRWERLKMKWSSNMCTTKPISGLFCARNLAEKRKYSFLPRFGVASFQNVRLCYRVTQVKITDFKMLDTYI